MSDTISPNIFGSLEDEGMTCHAADSLCNTAQCPAWVWLDIQNDLGLCGSVPANVEFIRRALILESETIV
jgi:hypothetical protein